MNETLLSYLWTYQYFDRSDLVTTDRVKLTVLHPGILNSNQGPDFSQARILLDDLEWYGNVELHVKSSDWIAHHKGDDKYDSTVLHVVWDFNKEIYRTDGSLVPTLELKGRVSEELLAQCMELVGSKTEPACRNYWSEIPSIYFYQMVERCAAEKLERKARMLLDRVYEKNTSWDEILWQEVANSMMQKINKAPMEHLLNLLPYKLLYRYRENSLNLEALFLGQSGLLPDDSNSAYAQRLNTEYRYLQHLFGLGKSMQRSQWNFLRTRPGNFPQVRLVQLARIMCRLDFLKQRMLENVEVRDLKSCFSGLRKDDDDLDPYHFLGIRNYHLEAGDDTLNGLVMNALAPWMVAYSIYHNQPHYADRALDWLQQLRPESNKITRYFDNGYFKLLNALESQGAIWLFEQYCQPKKCLSCRIGCKILHGVAEYSS